MSTGPVGRGPAPAGRLATGSVRLRIIVAVLAVLAVVMVAAGVTVGAVYRRQATNAADAVLASRVQLARQLARTRIKPLMFYQRLDAQGVRARLELPGGRDYGSVPDRGPHRTIRLVSPGELNGAQLTLTVDTTLLDQARRSLVRSLFLTGLLGLAAAALLALGAVALALRPLRSMADTARRIAAGERGTRLRPTRPATELGQTAVAFDSMLDSLEGAEHRALASEAGVKAFVADAAHELRTPLAGVSAAAQTLLHEDLPPETRDELLGHLVREAERGSRLVADLSTMAALDARTEGRTAPPARVELAPVVQASFTRVRHAYPQLRCELGGDPAAALVAPPDAVASVLANVIDNAARAASVRGPDGYVWVGITPGPVITVDVADNGPGIPAEDTERVFDRLVRLDPARAIGHGSGLGLAIARAQARSFGGELVCLTGHSDIGGAIFHFTAPAAP